MYTIGKGDDSSPSSITDDVHIFDIITPEFVGFESLGEEENIDAVFSHEDTCHNSSTALTNSWAWILRRCAWKIGVATRNTKQFQEWIFHVLKRYDNKGNTSDRFGDHNKSHFHSSHLLSERSSQARHF